MPRHEKIILYISGTAIDFTWLYALTVFSAVSLGGHPLTVIPLLIVFIFAAMMTHLMHGKGLRIITVGLAGALGLAISLILAAYLISGSGRTILDYIWLKEFFLAPHRAIDWLRTISVLFWTAAIWFAGIFFALRPLGHERVSSRFDVGLAAFLCLFLLKFVIEMKGGAKIHDNLMLACACVFFFFGLLAIGITRASGPENARIVDGRRKVGIMFGFIGAVFLSVIGLVVFLRQPLAQAAGMGYSILTKAGSSAGSIFVQFIRFLYLPKQMKIKEPPSGGQGSIFDHLSSGAASPWTETVGRALTWLFGTFMGIMIVMVITAGIIAIVRWLMARTARHDRTARLRCKSPAARYRVKALIASLLKHLKPRETAADYYRAFKFWSLLSGIRKRQNETPSEFSARIGKIFPAIAAETGFITYAFNREFYGNIRLTGEEMACVRSNWRKLKNPGLWPHRVRSLVRKHPVPH